MSFINVVIAFGPGKEEGFRIHMRNEFEDCGLSEFLEVRLGTVVFCPSGHDPSTRFALTRGQPPGTCIDVGMATRLR